METKLEEFIPTRESLLSRIKDWNDQDSWREFFGIYRGLISHTALRAGLTEHEAQDVVQETIISVAKTIKGFDYDPQRCSFKTWLRHLTRKRIADSFRKRTRKSSLIPISEETSSATPWIERIPDPANFNLDDVWEEEWKQQLFEAAIERVKLQVSPEQYQVFDLYVLRKTPAKKVAMLLDTNIAQVYLAKHRVSQMIRKEIKRLEKRMS